MNKNMEKLSKFHKKVEQEDFFVPLVDLKNKDLDNLKKLKADFKTHKKHYLNKVIIIAVFVIFKKKALEKEKNSKNVNEEKLSKLKKAELDALKNYEQSRKSLEEIVDILVLCVEDTLI